MPRYQERLVSDPLPVRYGKTMSGGAFFTKKEFACVEQVLKACAGRTLTRSEHDEHWWVAFTSCLGGNYIRETYPGSNVYILTDKGTLYLAQLGRS